MSVDGETELTHLATSLVEQGLKERKGTLVISDETKTFYFSDGFDPAVLHGEYRIVGLYSYKEKGVNEVVEMLSQGYVNRDASAEITKKWLQR